MIATNGGGYTGSGVFVEDDQDEDEEDVEEEDHDGDGCHQLLWGRLLVRDGGVGADDESKQGSVRRHPSTSTLL